MNRLKCTRVLLPALALLYLAAPGESQAGGDNWNHELLVYSLDTYQGFQDEPDGWKSSVPTNSYQDPYEDFWHQLYTNCHTDVCAKERVSSNGSLRRKNSQVSVNSMVQTSDGWPDADMVFFYGHNTQIRPQWTNGFDLWRPVLAIPGEPVVWDEIHLSDWQDWGTWAEPYRYHRDLITDASLENPYAVFYAYNALTSVLVGHDFREGTWNTENYYTQSSANARSGQLGGDLEWLIANGCNAVTVADYHNTGNTCSASTVESDCDADEGCFSGYCHDVWSIPLGVNAWKKSWGDLHIVLGHYHSTSVSILPNLQGYATDLREGDKIKTAYFDRHSSPAPYWASRNSKSYGPAFGEPSAISIASTSCCSGGTYYWCNPMCMQNHMTWETWNSPRADISGDVYYTTSRRVRVY